MVNLLLSGFSFFLCYFNQQIIYHLIYVTFFSLALLWVLGTLPGKRIETYLLFKFVFVFNRNYSTKRILPVSNIVIAFLFSKYLSVAYFVPNPDPYLANIGLSSFFSFHTVHGVLKARRLEWFASPFSNGPNFDSLCSYKRVLLNWHVLCDWEGRA